MTGCCGTPSWSAEGSRGHRLDSVWGAREGTPPQEAAEAAVRTPTTPRREPAAMGEDLVTTLSMENGGGGGGHHGPCTLLSMDPSGHLSAPDDRAAVAMVQALIGGGGAGARAHAVSPSGAPPPDINQPWQTDLCDMLDVGLGPQVYSAAEAVLSCAPKAGSRKAARRGDTIWGAWFFFTFYFKPLLSDKCKDKVVRDNNNNNGGVSAGFDKSDLRLDMFLVQHDMENMYMWVFKERPENALGKMQLRSYMNGHSRPGEPQFPFSVDRGFVRSHRMQRKHYRGLSNPQCIHGIEVVRSPNLAGLTEADLRRWAELTGRELNFIIPQEASDFGTWRNIPNSELELEKPHPVMKSNGTQNPKKAGLNLSSPSNHSGEDGMDLSPVSSKRRKELSPQAMDEEMFFLLNSCPQKTQQDVEMHSPAQPAWLHEFAGVMRNACGPVTAAKSIYEDDQGYLIMVSLPFVDQQRVKVSWRNTLTHGIVKIVCVSTGRMQHIRRHGRMFALADPSPEHCPSGDFIREIPLATRIPEDAKLEACFDEAASVLEIMVPKRGNEPEEHEVRVSLRPPHFGANDLLLT